MAFTSSSTALAVQWVEQGRVPDGVVRMAIRRLLRQRLQEVGADEPEVQAQLKSAFIDELRQAPLALVPHKANEQHYDVPAEFFATVLGPHRKYSSAWWPQGVHTLEAAESAALQLTCERAQLSDGQRILELGCGWGSLTLWMAEHYPNAHITAVSNSHSQRATLLALAAQRGLLNIEVVTCDFNDFNTAERFDRVVSVEMFEHLRNWPLAFAHVARWLAPQGKFFMHVFAHRGAPYPFVERDASDWMSQHFFSGGMMPSEDLALSFQDDLQVLQRWCWSGTHYQRTAEAWLDRMDAGRSRLMTLFEKTYGADARLWWQRWRLFLMSVAELFGHAGGSQWLVCHYLMGPRP